MTTALSIIQQSMRKIHVLGRGQSLQNDEAQDALTTLNNLIASWSVEGGLVYTESKDSFTATGATSYTIGSGGDVNIDRPFNITACFISNGTTDYPLTFIDEVDYSEIATKTTTGIADKYYYDNNFPLANLYLYPIPNGTYTVNIYSAKPLTAFTSLSDDISMPSGYEMALVLSLALYLAPDYEKQPDANLVKLAGEAKDNVFAYNTRNSSITSTIDSSLISNSGFNIYRGY